EEEKNACPLPFQGFRAQSVVFVNGPKIKIALQVGGRSATEKRPDTLRVFPFAMSENDQRPGCADLFILFPAIVNFGETQWPGRCPGIALRRTVRGEQGKNGQFFREICRADSRLVFQKDGPERKEFFVAS